MLAALEGRQLDFIVHIWELYFHASGKYLDRWKIAIHLPEKSPRSRSPGF